MIGKEERPFAEREEKLNALLEAEEKKLVSAILALKDEQERVRTAAEKTKACALLEFEETRTQMAEKITARFQAEVAPLVEKFVEQPSRSLARDIFELWQVSAESMKRLCGEAFDDFQLAVPFMLQFAKNEPSGMLFFANDNSQPVLLQLNQLVGMTHPVQWEAALPHLELAILSFGRERIVSHCEADIERAISKFARITKGGTRRLRGLASAQCNAEFEAQRSADAIERSKSQPDRAILHHHH